MIAKRNSLYRVLGNIFVANLLLFLCSTPIFYLIVSLSPVSTDFIDLFFSGLYLSVRLLRFLVVIVISCVIRKRNQEVFSANALLRKRFMKVIVGCICVSLWLHYSNITPTLYHTVSYMMGIYKLDTTPLFLSVLWEQLFAGDLYWSTLLSLSIVFFVRRDGAVLNSTIGKTAKDKQGAN